jgi:hypothetical protein
MLQWREVLVVNLTALDTDKEVTTLPAVASPISSIYGRSRRRPRLRDDTRMK